MAILFIYAYPVGALQHVPLSTDHEFHVVATHPEGAG
jgi:hypothetical protein